MKLVLAIKDWELRIGILPSFFGWAIKDEEGLGISEAHTFRKLNSYVR